jgi:short-subunit dehydrogenase
VALVTGASSGPGPLVARHAAAHGARPAICARDGAELEADDDLRQRSIGGKVSVPHTLPYSTSKFALAGFSEGLRGELAVGLHDLPGLFAEINPSSTPCSQNRRRTRLHRAGARRSVGGSTT